MVELAQLRRFEQVISSEEVVGTDMDADSHDDSPLQLMEQLYSSEGQ